MLQGFQHLMQDAWAITRRRMWIMISLMTTVCMGLILSIPATAWAQSGPTVSLSSSIAEMWPPGYNGYLGGDVTYAATVSLSGGGSGTNTLALYVNGWDSPTYGGQQSEAGTCTINGSSGTCTIEWWAGETPAGYGAEFTNVPPYSAMLTDNGQDVNGSSLGDPWVQGESPSLTGLSASSTTAPVGSTITLSQNANASGTFFSSPFYDTSNDNRLVYGVILRVLPSGYYAVVSETPFYYPGLYASGPSSGYNIGPQAVQQVNIPVRLGTTTYYSTTIGVPWAEAIDRSYPTTPPTIPQLCTNNNSPNGVAYDGSAGEILYGTCIDLGELSNAPLQQVTVTGTLSGVAMSPATQSLANGQTTPVRVFNTDGVSGTMTITNDETGQTVAQCSNAASCSYTPAPQAPGTVLTFSGQEQITQETSTGSPGTWEYSRQQGWHLVGYYPPTYNTFTIPASTGSVLYWAPATTVSVAALVPNTTTPTPTQSVTLTGITSLHLSGGQTVLRDLTTGQNVGQELPNGTLVGNNGAVAVSEGDILHWIPNWNTLLSLGDGGQPIEWDSAWPEATGVAIANGATSPTDFAGPNTSITWQVGPYPNNTTQTYQWQTTENGTTTDSNGVTIHWATATPPMIVVNPSTTEAPNGQIVNVTISWTPPLASGQSVTLTDASTGQVLTTCDVQGSTSCTVPLTGTNTSVPLVGSYPAEGIQSSSVTVTWVSETTITTSTGNACVPPTFEGCMPNPVETTYQGQTIEPPTNDQWVTQGGAQPDTLLPGPGWAIDGTPIEQTTTDCTGSGTSKTCTTSQQQVGTTYQEVYDPQQCPYPVVTTN